MDPVHLPVYTPVASPLDRDLAELEAAINLVRGGAALRVRIVGLTAPERLIGTAVARCQAVGVRVRIDRHDTGTTLIVETGP